MFFTKRNTLTTIPILAFFIIGAILFPILASSSGLRLWAVLTAVLCLCTLFLIYFNSISQRDEAEQSFEESRLKTLVDLSAMTEAPLDEIVHFVLDEAVRLTKSQMGYLAFMDEEQAVLTIQAWSKNAMELCAMEDKPMVYKVEETGLWGEAFRQKKPIVTNDYSVPNPAKKGLPAGHAPIKRHMNLPVIVRGKVAAIAGVANKKEPYDETDVRQFTLLMQGMWRLVEEQRNKASLENELHESERKLATLMNNLPGMAYRCRNDQNWTMEFISQGSLDLTGYSCDEIVGNRVTSYNALIHPDEQEMVWDEVQSCIAGKKPFVVVYRLITKAGREKWVWEKGRGIYSADGQLEAIEGFVTSVSEQLEALQELRKLQNLFSNIVNSMPSILVAVDQKGLVTQWNQEAENSTGIEAAYAEGKYLEDVLPKMAGKMGMVQEAMESNASVKKSKVAGSRPEHGKYYDFTVFPLVFEGEKGAVIRIDDITERVHIEEMMMQSEKMLSLGGLAAGMAHEINNPLGGIIQNVQVVTHRLTWNSKKNLQQAGESGLSFDALQDYLQKRGIVKLLNLVFETGLRASSIVENMLDFSRTNQQSGVQDTSLDLLLDKTVEIAANDLSLHRDSKFSKIRIIKEYDDTIQSVPGEPGKLQQVILNLLKNAAQAMEGNPKEQEPAVWLRLVDEPDFVRMEIEDNGPGVPEEVRAKIFEPFFTTKPAGIGTGLGLSVSFFIVTQVHQGTMEVESPSGKGAKFIIRLPKVRTPEEEDPDEKD
ncbi:PAS domain S-box-containing protein [Desulfatibacillum alkenivorans DSM 16219]|jgi:PAS domain S-box-containing protein|uniref:histidine kinase n=1 Tax=Desulfatibacillum alkenivorans DSM 16219 TaxID=1121393 RepID=A0A1M6TRD8_9BACT|nr:PAS domain S-box-containing protein [Desulfatibacillum alkenivorans DSM 16219]